MKKFLLSIFAVMLAVFSVQAETKTYTYDFSKNTNWVTTKGGSTAVATGSGNKLNAFYDKATGDVFNAGGKGYFNSGYFLWGKSGAYIELPTYSGEKITKVTAKSSSGVSANVTVGVYNGTTSVVKAVKWAKSTSYDYDIPDAYQSSVLRLQVANSYNAQIVSITITTETIGEGGGETVVDVAEPTFTPASGTTFEDELDITIVAEDGLTVHCSTDNKESYTVGNAVKIAESTTIYAYTEDADGNQSDVVSATYTKIEPKTIAEVIAAGVGNAMTRGTVVATYSRGFLLGDGTGYILVYQGSDKGIVAGEVVTVSGATSEYGGLLQFGTSPVVEKTGTAKVEHPNVTTMDAAAMDAYLAKPSVQYVEYTGTLSVDTEKGYYNVAIDGAKTAVGSISYPKAGIVEAEDGDVVKVTGYTIGVSNSSGSPKYVNTMAVSVEVVEGGATDPEEPETPEIPEEPETPGLVTAPCYVKVTSAPADWSGKYLIVYEDGADAYVFKALEAANNYVDATIENGVILATEELNSVAVELAPMNGGYSVKTSAGYISGAKDKNKLDFNATTAQLNSVEFVDGEGVKITSNTSVFRFNSAKDNLRFRYFKSSTFESQKPIQLYKYTEPAASQSYTLSVSAAGWATLYLDFNAEIPAFEGEDAGAYIVKASGINDGYITLTPVTGVLPANTGIIVKAAENDYNFVASTGAAADVTGNLLSGTTKDTVIESAVYVLGIKDGVVGLYTATTNGYAEGTFLNNANKAYLPKTAGMSAASYSFRFGEGTTAIENVEVENEVKTIYDLTGRRVEEVTAPGIYIINGKKVLVK